MSGINLTSFAQGYRALVFGASGGIGRAFVKALTADARCAQVYAAARGAVPSEPKVSPLAFALEDEASIVRAVAEATADGPLDLVIVATGLLHDAGISPEKSWRALDEDNLEELFRVNAIGPALIAKHVFGHLRADRKSAFVALSARVGSIEDNRLGGWHGYRASKAALNMLIKTCAIELARRNPHAVCVTTHPGTVDTGLSKPFRSSVRPEALFTPEHSVACLLSVIDRATSADTGKLLAWDGAVIPY